MEATPLSTAPPASRRTSGASRPAGATAALLLASLGLLIVLYMFGAPVVILAIPFMTVITMACLAQPAAVSVLMLFISGFIGTLIAFLGIPIDALAGSLLLGLWLAVIATYVTGRAREPLWLLPALLPLGLYVAVTLVQMLTSDSITYAFADFRITVWYMLAVLLMAVAPWHSDVFRKLILGFTAVTLLVGLYALYRYIFGESPQEFELARNSVQRVAYSVPVRFYGSFLSAFQLAGWGATAIPLLIAVAFVTKRPWRPIAIAAIALCTFAIFASEVRTGLVAAVVGSAVVIGLFMTSRAFAAQRIGAVFFAVLGLIVIGVGGYAALVAGSEARADRFENILNPSRDFAFQERLTRWDAALETVEEEPLGHGLGTQGYVGQNVNPERQAGPFNLDSSYLKVGIQQGYLMMLLFAGAQLALLAGIALRAIRIQDRWRCALGVAACGTLVAQMFLFFNGIYSEGVTSLAAWIVIGIGAAQFTSAARLGEDASEPATAS